MTKIIAFRVFVLLLLLIVCFPLHFAVAAERVPVSLKVLPAHVGVFYELKTQQFQAIATFADGSQADYTDKVGWSLEANPFSEQTKTPGEVAGIDQNGLATVISTWGRVNVIATYPPPPKFTPSAIGLLLLKPPPRLVFPGILSLLLKGGMYGATDSSAGDAGVVSSVSEIAGKDETVAVSCIQGLKFVFAATDVGINTFCMAVPSSEAQSSGSVPGSVAGSVFREWNTFQRNRSVSCID